MKTLLLSAITYASNNWYYASAPCDYALTHNYSIPVIFSNYFILFQSTVLKNDRVKNEQTSHRMRFDHAQSSPPQGNNYI